MSKNLLILGGGGFVGQWLCSAAVADGWDVVAVARRAGSPAAKLRRVSADINELQVISPLVEASDAVVYNAAHIPTSFSDPAAAEQCLKTNALGVLWVLELMAKSARKPLLYVSTGQGYVNDGRAVDENDALFPAVGAPFYLGSKLLGDIYVEHYRVAKGVPTCVLRLGALYGPGRRHGMVAQFIRGALAGDTLEIQDGGGFSSDLTFVGDVADAMIRVLNRQAVGIFNIGSGRSTTVREAAQWILEAAGRGSSNLLVRPRTGTGSLGFAALNIERARRDLGFAPTDPRAGIVKTVQEWTSPAWNVDNG